MADAYLQSLLGDGETIRSEARQHPMALIRFALQPILVFIAALVSLAIGTWLTPDGEGLFSDIVRWIDTLLGLLTAGLFILAVVWFPVQVFRWLQRRYLVSDRRVLYVDGVLRKNSADAGLSMITDVGFRQGVLGRTLGYGDLVIATASNRPLHFRQIKDALAFKQAIMAAQHATVEARADEILLAKGLAPASAAVAAAASVAPVVPVAPVAAAASVTPVAPSAAAVAASVVEPVAAPAEPAPPPRPAWDGSDMPEMVEDDVPALDPAIFGGPGVPAVVTTAEPQTEPMVEGAVTPAEPVTAAPEPLTERVDEAAEAIETVAGETASVTQATADGAGETAEAVAETTGDVVDTTPEPVEAAGDNAGEPEEGAEVDDVAEAATSLAPGAHVAALDDVDSRIGSLTSDAVGAGAESVTSAIARLAELRDSGAITPEEFETRKQELLDRL